MPSVCKAGNKVGLTATPENPVDGENRPGFVMFEKVKSSAVTFDGSLHGYVGRWVNLMRLGAGPGSGMQKSWVGSESDRERTKNDARRRMLATAFRCAYENLNLDASGGKAVSIQKNRHPIQFEDKRFEALAKENCFF